MILFVKRRHNTGQGNAGSLGNVVVRQVVR
jgi:hypothetical protein